MIIYRKANSSDFCALKEVWLTCFDDTNEAVELFFKNIANYEAYCAEDNGKAVSALYLIRTGLNYERAHYLCGASTLPAYRRRGIMAELIKYALNESVKDGDKYSLLLPANQGLYSFYEKLGYKPKCSCVKYIFSRKELKQKASYCKLDNILDYETMQSRCFKRDFMFLSGSFIEFAADYYKLYGTKCVRNNSGFAFFEENGDTAEVFYSCYSDFSSLARLMIDSTGADRFVFTDKAGNEQTKDFIRMTYGMIKPLCGDKDFDGNNVYIGLTLN